ncbi:MAG TPA: carbohydrate-binding protein, partial [Flavisolibacter sp.]|nr:carbohydrate-binding protein [Flavisolibacter sp.]
ADGTVLANVKIPNTGGYQSWQTVSATIVLPLGKQTLRVVSTAPVWNSWNINWISFNNPSAATTPNPPPVPAPGTNYLLIPAKIEAENWLTMSGAQTEITSDVGGGLDVSYMDPADWMDYAVNAPTAGSYTVQFRIGTPAYNAQLELRQANGTVLANVKMPYTGGYQSWQTVSVTVNLPQGQQVLRIVSTSPQWNSWNINWISFSNGTAVAGTTIMANTSLRSPISNVSGTSFNIYPVPARDALTLDINNENTGKLIVQVVGLNGIVQKEYTYYKNDPGNNQVHLNIGDLPRGEYFLKAKMANWNNSRKITKL